MPTDAARLARGEPLRRAPARASREFAFTAEDFERVRRLIRAHAGIALPAGKENLVYSRLSPSIRAGGHASVRGYLDALQAGPPAGWQRFVNALTTNHTGFFREAHHFDALIAALRDAGPAPHVVWCAGAATGEEAWSLAITACEAFESLAPPVRIVATDVDTDALTLARRGIYAGDAVASLSAARRRRHFTANESTGAMSVRAELRALVSFQAHSLVAPLWPAMPPLSAIFCRNVLIYFDRTTRERVVARFHPILRADGMLCLGHSEALSPAHALFRPHGRTVYMPRTAES
jgi:chemotaxis protein methyltransferase CheR